MVKMVSEGGGGVKLEVLMLLTPVIAITDLVLW